MSNLKEITSFLEYLGDAIIIVNESSELIFANSACSEFFGSPAQDMRGMLIDNLMTPLHKLNHQEMVKKYIQSNSSAKTMMNRGLLPCLDASGKIFNARISIASVTIDNQLYGVATIQDFTYIQKEIEHLEIAAHQDTLTGLYNRRYLQEISGSNSRILHTWKDIGVIYIDLNKFKHVNDKYGHEVGDVVLRMVSKRINGCIRYDDIALRMGGDEFLVLLNLTNIHNKAESVNQIAENIHSEVIRPIETKHTNIKIGLSAGCGLYPKDENNLMKLIDMVDKAMYTAKETGEHITNVDVRPNNAN